MALAVGDTTNQTCPPQAEPLARACGPYYVTGLAPGALKTSPSVYAILTDTLFIIETRRIAFSHGDQV